MATSLPALDVKQPDVMEGIQKALAIRSMLFGQQLSSQDLANKQLTGQQLAMQIEGQQRLRAAQSDPNWDATDVDGATKIMQHYGVPLDTASGVIKAIGEIRTGRQQQSAQEISATKNAHDYLDDQLQSVKSAPLDSKQSVYQDALSNVRRYVTLLPDGPAKTQFLAELGNAPAIYDANWINQQHTQLRTMSQLNEEALKLAQAREASGKGAQAEAEAGKLTGEGTPGSPFFAPTPAATAIAAANKEPWAVAVNKGEAAQAGAKAGAEAAAKFPYELSLKQQELAQNPVFAVNPKTGQRELTTVADAKAQGFTNPIKASQVDVEKETQLNSQLNDLQLNTSRYKAALNAMGNLSASDRMNMTRILSDKSISGYLTNELTLGAVMDQISQGEKASAWNALSPDKQAALIGSLRMRNSALLFQKVATGMGRASKEALDIELSNMPSPIEGATVGNQKIDAFQENVDQMAARSVKLPWMEQAKDVRARIEGQAVDQYNKTQAAKPQGQYRGTPSQDTGKKAYEPGMTLLIHGVPRTVSKIYSDGTFDVQ